MECFVLILKGGIKNKKMNINEEWKVITVEELANYIEEGMLVKWKKKLYCIQPSWYSTPAGFIITNEEGQGVTTITSKTDLLVLEEDRTKEGNIILKIFEVIE